MWDPKCQCVCFESVRRAVGCARTVETRLKSAPIIVSDDPPVLIFNERQGP